MADGSSAGFVDARFARVQEVFEASLANGADVGASFCATVEGETVVDLWGGFADEARTRPWERDTIVNVYSTTKTMTALSALLLADQGELDFDAPVTRYWPQYGANGKEETRVSHFMAHSAGAPGWKAPMTTADLYDWEKATELLARQEPYWAPGTKVGYHAITQGYLVGEVIRRITGQSLGTFFRKEIAEPLGADFHIGLPASEDSRVADLIPPPPGSTITDGAPNDMARQVFSNPSVDPRDTRTRAWRAAEIPAAGGHGNARSVAEIQVLLANGGTAKGKRLLSEAGARKALEPQFEGQDLMMNAPARFGLGFGLPGPAFPLPHADTIYWGGYGGSIIVIDYEARTTFSYVMNKMAPTTTGDLRGFSLIMEMWQALG